MRQQVVHPTVWINKLWRRSSEFKRHCVDREVATRQIHEYRIRELHLGFAGVGRIRLSAMGGDL